MVVYLNFDGVLHPNHLSYRHRRLPELQCPGHTVFEYVPALAEALVEHPDAAVVLNTWWTYHLAVDACLELLPTFIRKRVLGTTLRTAIYEGALPSRLREAEKHISAHAKEILILDNSAARYCSNLRPYLLLVDEERGLSCHSAMRALNRRLSTSQHNRINTSHSSTYVSSTQ